MSGETLEILELTPRGRGAVSVVALRGPGALDVVRAFVPGVQLVLGRPALVRFRAQGELIDEGVVYAESEREVELHLHGAPAVVDRMMALLSPRQRAVARGETLEERAWKLLSTAQSDACARMLLDQAQGVLRAELAGIRADPDPRAAREKLGRLLETAVVARRLLEPPTVVIAGPANAGKSTLFNLLVGSERAIVHATPGTTRDVLTERVHLGRYLVRLQDTAGERALPGSDPSEAIEARGQELARSFAGKADLVLWLSPPWEERWPAEEGSRLRVLHSRADEGPAPRSPSLSCHREPERARAVVEAAFHEALGLSPDPWRAGAPVLFSGEIAELVRSLLARPVTPEMLREVLDPLLRR